MTAQILNLRDFKRKEEKPKEATLEQMACELMDVVFNPELHEPTPNKEPA